MCGQAEGLLSQEFQWKSRALVEGLRRDEIRSNPSGNNYQLQEEYMKMMVRMVLLPLVLSGSYLIGQTQIEQHGWKLISVTYKDENTSTQKDDKQYGEPGVALFVKDYPYQDGKEYPKLLVLYLSEDTLGEGIRPRVRKTLDEFDCPRKLQRTIRWFWSDNREENKRNLSELTKWDEVPPDTPVEAIYKYACRNWRVPPKK
jgi:hypothetical protein